MYMAVFGYSQKLSEDDELTICMLEMHYEIHGC